jgi:hypothetical protein
MPNGELSAIDLVLFERLEAHQEETAASYGCMAKS